MLQSDCSIQCYITCIYGLYPHTDGHVPPGGVAPSEHMLPGGVAPGDSDALRHVETDVLIPKKMRSKSMKLCADYVKVFEDCVRGRTVTMVWACREESKRMKECLAS